MSGWKWLKTECIIHNFLFLFDESASIQRKSATFPKSKACYSKLKAAWSQRLTQEGKSTLRWLMSLSNWTKEWQQTYPSCLAKLTACFNQTWRYKLPASDSDWYAVFGGPHYLLITLEDGTDGDITIASSLSSCKIMYKTHSASKKQTHVIMEQNGLISAMLWNR